MQNSSVAPLADALAPADCTVVGHLPSAYLASWAVRGRLYTMRKAESEMLVEALPPEAIQIVPQSHQSEDLPAELAQLLEQQLSALALPDPAAALQPILQHPVVDWDATSRENWVRFIVSLLLLNPSIVAQVAAAMRDILAIGTRELKRRYASKRSDPKTFAEYVTRSNPQAPVGAATQYLRKVMNGDAIAATISKMKWTRITVSEARFTLLTSDQPLDVPQNLADKNAYIALPLSPTMLFVASNNSGLLDTLAKHDPSKVVRMMNLTTVTRAHERVWSIDESQLSFIKHHFGAAPATPQLPDGARQDALATLRRRPKAG